MTKKNAWRLQQTVLVGCRPIFPGSIFISLTSITTGTNTWSQGLHCATHLKEWLCKSLSELNKAFCRTPTTVYSKSLFKPADSISKETYGWHNLFSKQWREEQDLNNQKITLLNEELLDLYEVSILVLSSHFLPPFAPIWIASILGQRAIFFALARSFYSGFLYIKWPIQIPPKEWIKNSDFFWKNQINLNDNLNLKNTFFFQP